MDALVMQEDPNNWDDILNNIETLNVDVKNKLKAGFHAALELIHHFHEQWNKMEGDDNVHVTIHSPIIDLTNKIGELKANPPFNQLNNELFKALFIYVIACKDLIIYDKTIVGSKINAGFIVAAYEGVIQSKNALKKPEETLKDSDYRIASYIALAFGLCMSFQISENSDDGGDDYKVTDDDQLKILDIVKAMRLLSLINGDNLPQYKVAALLVGSFKGVAIGQTFIGNPVLPYYKNLWSLADSGKTFVEREQADIDFHNPLFQQIATYLAQSRVLFKAEGWDPGSDEDRTMHIREFKTFDHHS